MTMKFIGIDTDHKIPNLTPLIDFVFLLLIFFMLTAHFVKDQSLDVSLPEASHVAALDDQNSLEITVDHKGEILIDNNPIKIDQLDDLLKKSLQGRSNKRVILRGDKNSRLDITVKIMDAARKAGATSLDIVTAQP